MAYPTEPPKTPKPEYPPAVATRRQKWIAIVIVAIVALVAVYKGLQEPVDSKAESKSETAAPA